MSRIDDDFKVSCMCYQAKQLKLKKTDKTYPLFYAQTLPPAPVHRVKITAHSGNPPPRSIHNFNTVDLYNVVDKYIIL
jgi:hypothetical protein